MITGELKNKVDGLWDIFAAGGLVNPLDVIEQITYLMFIHDLDEADNLRAKESAMLGLPYQSMFADNLGVLKDLSVLQETPFTDKGSVVEVFTDLSVWMKIRNAIEKVNANAVA